MALIQVGVVQKHRPPTTLTLTTDHRSFTTDQKNHRPPTKGREKTDQRPEQQPTIDQRPMAVKNTDHQPDYGCSATDHRSHCKYALGPIPFMRQALS